MTSAVARGDEDTATDVQPIVKLEEDEEVLLEMKAKLYRFHKEGNQWQERGVGNLKLLKLLISFVFVKFGANYG
ncbi:Ran-binding 1-like protein c [Nymphaea thermarum]|nr:Ran-binding 1-like protein c [Nymphaea thermarum]